MKILTADYLITGDGKTVLENGALLLDGGKILKVDTLEALRAAYPAADVEAHPGCTLMPGMIDMHDHIGFYWDRPDEKDFETYRAMQGFFVAKRMADTLRAGVTTIRDVASPDNVGIAITKARAAGYIQAPRIFTSCMGICINMCTASIRKFMPFFS